jgi:hypothetical protein
MPEKGTRRGKKGDATVADSGLTPSERRRLGELESLLSQDTRLERRLRTMRPHPVWRAAVLPLLGVLSLALMVAGAATSQPVVIGAFAVVWPLTCGLAFRALFRAFRDPPRSTR